MPTLSLKNPCGSWLPALLVGVLSIGGLSFCDVAHAAPAPKTIICKNTTTGAINLRLRRCKGTESKLDNISLLTGATGTNGTNGADGADGSLRIYGDGSDGALVVSTTIALSGVSKQYSSVTVEPGITLTVASGTIIRVTGAFTNNGTIAVGQFATGGYINTVPASSGSSPSISPALPGIALVVSGQGAFGTNANTLFGGVLGIALSDEYAENILNPGVLGGGGGGAGFASLGGGQGGGTFTVLASGAISNNGPINADGISGGIGSGGGAGGIVILASKTSVTNTSTGSITALGGDGGVASTDSGGGGGGGGGIVHLIAPTAPTNAGTISLTGGTAGSNVTAVTNSPRIGGGGGGSCAGAGGAGSSVSTGDVSSGNGAGGIGKSFLTTADPTAMF